MRRIRVSVGTLVMLMGVSLATPTGQAQAPAVTAEQTHGQMLGGGREVPRFTSGVDLVTLDVCVRTTGGRLVSDLRPEDFAVFESGRRQRVAWFAPRQDVPLSVVLLIDVSDSMAGDKLRHSLEAAQLFADTLRSEDRVEILVFNHRAIRLRGFDEASLVEPAILRWERGEELSAPSAAGSTALFDAVVIATTDLVHARRDRVNTRDVVVVLSDGEDTSSRLTFEDVLSAVSESGVLVYSVSVRLSDRGTRLGATWPLLQLAHVTGARALSAPQPGGLAVLYRDIQTELRHLYRLAYMSTDARLDGQWRAIAVRVPSQAVQVTTRAGYYAKRRPSP